MEISTITKYIENLVNIPSPTGFTKLAEKYLMDEFTKLGYAPYQNNKGNVIVPVSYTHLRKIRWTHKVGPNTRVRTKLALVFLCYFLPLGVGNFYAAFFFLYSIGDKYPNFSFILSSL